MDTVLNPHINPVAKLSAKSDTFGARHYLEGLMSELDRAAISVRMGEARDQAGFTQPEIAEILHVHMRTVQDWESPKKRALPFDRMDEWARLTKVNREWLLYGDSEDSDRLSAIEEELRLVREQLEAVRAAQPDVDRVLALARDLQALLRERSGTG